MLLSCENGVTRSKIIDQADTSWHHQKIYGLCGTTPSVDNDDYDDNDVTRHTGPILTTLIPPVLVCILQKQLLCSHPIIHMQPDDPQT